MKIELKKLGTTLISRPAGKEALNAIESTLHGIGHRESIEIDFSGVLTFSPSWGDEFLTPLINRFADRLVLIPGDNLSVKATLEILEKINNKKFKIKADLF